MKKKSSLLTVGEIKAIQVDFKNTFLDVPVEDIDTEAVTEWAMNTRPLMERWAPVIESRLELMKNGRKDHKNRSMLDKDHDWYLDYNPLFLLECAIADKLRTFVTEEVATSLGSDLYDVAKEIIAYYRKEWEISQKQVDKESTAV